MEKKYINIGMNNQHKKINNIKDSSSKKKIGFFSVILLVVGSCIGAGIFFKNKSILADAQGSIVLAIIC
jgi:amino acid transporter